MGGRHLEGHNRAVGVCMRCLLVPSKTLVDVGKRIGLLIPDVPASIFQVCVIINRHLVNQQCSAVQQLKLLLLMNSAGHWDCHRLSALLYALAK